MTSYPIFPALLLRAPRCHFCDLFRDCNGVLYRMAHGYLCGECFEHLTEPVISNGWMRRIAERVRITVGNQGALPQAPGFGKA